MEARLAAETREARGKNHARRVRRAGRVPGVVYGGDTHGGQPVAVDPKELMRILRSESGVNTLIELALDGGDAGRVLVKEFQLDPISSDLLHVDFYRLAMDKALTVTVPVSLSGEAVGVKLQGGLVDFVTREVQVECMPSEIPEHIEVDVSELRVGDGVRLRDRVEGVAWTPVSDPDTLLVHVLPPKIEESAEEAEAEGADGVAEDKPEGADEAEG
ncbi:MAG: 50S ribosomal protein L25 [Acidobacteria bacterium]|nr:50S ribosomal protein L25 [Acidobacteriota bacterium]